MSTHTVPLGDVDTYSSDGALGPEVNTNNDRPPLGGFIFGPAYDGTCFIIKDNRLYYCKAKQPEAWPALNYIEVGSPQHPGKTGVFHGGQAYYFTAHDIYYIQGTGASVFQPIPMSGMTGAQSIRGAVSVAGIGIFHTGPDGIYLFANGSDRKITEDSLEPLFDGEGVNDMPAISDMSTSWLWSDANYLYFGYPDSSSPYPKNVIRLNLGTMKMQYYVYNDGADIEIRAITTDDTNERLLIGDSTGFVRVIEDCDCPDDSGTAISWETQSKDYTLPTRKHFPRWVKYDVDASGATAVTGKLLLDGTVHQTHTITGNRVTKRRLVGGGNGNKAAIRIAGSGPATIYTAEFE